MKDKVEIRAGVTITREEYEELHKAFNEPDTPKFGRWKPDKGERYYWCNSGGRALDDGWAMDSVDLARYEFGNVYRTEAEAQKEADRRRAEVRLTDWAAAHGAFEPNSGERRWVIDDDIDGGLEISYYTYARHPDEICFRTSDDAKRFLEECRDDLNIFWGIGEER